MQAGLNLGYHGNPESCFTVQASGCCSFIFVNRYKLYCCSSQNHVKGGKKLVQTDEWRQGSAEDRLEYALIKVRCQMIRQQEGFSQFTFSQNTFSHCKLKNSPSALFIKMSERKKQQVKSTNSSQTRIQLLTNRVPTQKVRAKITSITKSKDGELICGCSQSCKACMGEWKECVWVWQPVHVKRFGWRRESSRFETSAPETQAVTLTTHSGSLTKSSTGSLQMEKTTASSSKML